MLAEVGVGTAAELVMGVSYDASPPGPIFIPELDELLLSARPHVGGSSMQRGDLVEIVGPSGAGKTTLASFLQMTALLPGSITVDGVEVALGGRRMRAAFISPLSHAPPGPIIQRAMRAHVRQCIASASTSNHIDPGSTHVQDAIERVIHGSLTRLTVLQVKPRTIHWVSALKGLLATPLQRDQRGDHSHDATLALLVCDGMSDGYWPERWLSEESRKIEKHGITGPTQHSASAELWDTLTELRRDLGAVVVVTVQGLRPLSNTPFFKSQMAAPYPSIDNQRPQRPGETQGQGSWTINAQLTLLGPSRRLQLPVETTLVDSMRRNVARPIAVYDAIVRVPGGKGAPGTKEGARWSFGINEHGLVPFTKSEL